MNKKLRTTAYRAATKERFARIYQDEGTIGVEALIDMFSMEPKEFQGIEVYASKVYIKGLCEAVERMSSWQDDAENLFHESNEDEQRELQMEKPILDEILFLHIICDEVEKTEEPVFLVQQAVDCDNEISE
jgi:hypothetical protein